MPKYRLAKRSISDQTLVLQLVPAQEQSLIRFLPGQYAAISFKVGSRFSPARCFSMTSAPGQPYLEFVTAARGKFTSKLASLPEGTEFNVQGPFGSFTIDRDYDEKIIFFANGLGITPFMSMLRHAERTNFQTPITLVYSNRDQEQAPLSNEVQALSQKLPNLRVIRISGDSRQQINSAFVERITRGDVHGFSYFICGSPKYTKKLTRLLNQYAISKDSIITEAYSQSGNSIFSTSLSPSTWTYGLAAASLVAGIFSIMAIDLVRYIPKQQAVMAAKPAYKVTNSASSPTQDDGVKSSSDDQASNTLQQSTPAQTATPTYTNSYQPPVSTLS